MTGAVRRRQRVGGILNFYYGQRRSVTGSSVGQNAIQLSRCRSQSCKPCGDPLSDAVGLRRLLRSQSVDGTPDGVADDIHICPLVGQVQEPQQADDIGRMRSSRLKEQVLVLVVENA